VNEESAAVKAGALYLSQTAIVSEHRNLEMAIIIMMPFGRFVVEAESVPSLGIGLWA